MIVIPAIDIKDEKCVRLRQGRFDEQTTYFDDPVEVATMWSEQAAGLIHVVDLDGALKGEARHFSLIERMVKASDTGMEIGGGIRDINTVRRYMNAGVKRVVLGSAIVKDPDFVSHAASEFPGQIIAGIDAKAGFVAISGWVADTAVKVETLFHKAAELGVAGIIYTDIAKDGTLAGLDAAALSTVISSTKLAFVISGGVSSLDDIRTVAALGKKHDHIEGVITGKALYDGAFELKDAVSILKG